MRRLLPVLLPALLLAGCLPSSQRANTRAVTPADSLSMRLAEGAPVDTLRLAWTATAPEATPLELPTSLAWLPDSLGGRLVVADTRRGGLHTFTPEGAYDAEWRPEALPFPYLAGTRADTAVVYSRGARRLDFLRAGRVVRRLPLAADYSAVLATADALWAKRTDEGEAYLARLGEDGREAARYRLPAAYWRHVGFLRPWGTDLLSLSGYRPVVDRLPAGAPAGAALDSLYLWGFASPQLVRSYQFMLDEIDEPPLLTSSAAALGGRLYVLNLRVDEVRIDVYGPARDGAEGGLRLERALVFPAADLLASAFPVDLAVREDTAGGLRFALLLQSPGGVLAAPGGRLAMLAWNGPSAPPS